MAGSGTAHLRPADEVLLQVTDLVVEFPAGKGRTIKAVSGISFDIAPGETLGLVGESGCGKSTTGRALLRLPKPTSGSVVLDGEDLASLDVGLEGRLALRRPHRKVTGEHVVGGIDRTQLGLLGAADVLRVRAAW